MRPWNAVYYTYVLKGVQPQITQYEYERVVRAYSPKYIEIPTTEISTSNGYTVDCVSSELVFSEGRYDAITGSDGTVYRTREFENGWKVEILQPGGNVTYTPYWYLGSEPLMRLITSSVRFDANGAGTVDVSVIGYALYDTGSTSLVRLAVGGFTSAVNVNLQTENTAPLYNTIRV